MKKYIDVDKETKCKLMKIFGVCERVVRNALTYAQDNELAMKIRCAALENGGVTYTVNKEMECWHDNEGNMKMLFPNGAMVVLSKESGRGEVVFKGETVKEYVNVLVSDIDGIQRSAASLR